MKLENKDGINDVMVVVSSWEDQKRLNNYYMLMDWEFYNVQIWDRHPCIEKAVSFNRTKSWCALSSVPMFKRKLITVDDAIEMIEEFLKPKPVITMNKLKKIYVGISKVDGQDVLSFAVDDISKIEGRFNQYEIKIFSLSDNNCNRLDIDLPETKVKKTTPDIAVKVGIMAGTLANKSHSDEKKIKLLKDTVTEVVELCME